MEEQKEQEEQPVSPAVDADDPSLDKWEKARLENLRRETLKLQREITCALNGDPTVGHVGD